MDQIDCYKAILKQELLARKSANKGYSQAAFARDIQLSPPKLSQIFSNKCGLSKERAAKVARHLGFNENETKYFVSLVSSQHARSRKERERAQGVVESLAENSPVTVSKDQFELLKEWHHFAVLNLLNSVAEKRPLDAKAIAKRLGLPVGVVRQSMGLLEELGLMDENKDQRAIGLVKTTQDLPSRAIKHHHKQVMERAIKSLQNDPVEDREFQSLMFLAPRSEINNMKKLLRKQSLQFLKKFESNHSEDLYSLSIQLVPVTKKGKKGSE